MGKTRRGLIAVLAGTGLLKLGSDWVQSQEQQENTAAPEGGSGGVEKDFDAVGTATPTEESDQGRRVATPLPDDGPSDALYHERQSVYLNPGQAYAETFENTGQNTLHVRLRNVGLLNLRGLYSYDEWETLERSLETDGDWSAGNDIDPYISTSDSFKQYPLENDGRYAIVLGNPDTPVTGTPEPTNMQIEYWVLD